MPAKEAVEMAGQALDDEHEAGIMAINSTPHASPSDGDANQAGSCRFVPVKPALTYGEQLTLMESRGLVVPDEPAALRLLAEANYYRLRGYWLTLESDGRFRAGTTFDDVWDIYTLDSGLRLWLWAAIAPIEIKLRTSFSYHVGRALGPHQMGTGGFVHLVKALLFGDGVGNLLLCGRLLFGTAHGQQQQSGGQRRRGKFIQFHFDFLLFCGSVFGCS